MAIAFMRVRPLSRGNGQSAVACAAYRACVKLHDAFYDKDHDYSKKSGHIAGGLELPPGVKKTREELWNLVEESETRCDARFGKEILFAFPKELSDEDNIILAKRIARCLSEERKPDGSIEHFPIQWDMHGPHIEAIIDENGNFVLDDENKKKVQSNDNTHGHFLSTERAWDYETNSFSKKKNRNRNSKEWTAAKKLEIGEIVNAMLREKGFQEIDFRSWEERNAESIEKTGKELDRPQRHQGPAKTNSERKRRRRLARKKMSITDEIKLTEGELKKMEAKINNSSVKRTKNNVPTVGNLMEDIATSVNQEVAKKNAEKTISTRGGTVQIQSKIENLVETPKKTKPQQSVHDFPIPKTKPVGGQNGHAHSGPDHKCFICIPDGSDRCKYCKFREDDLEHSSGNSR